MIIEVALEPTEGKEETKWSMSELTKEVEKLDEVLRDKIIKHTQRYKEYEVALKPHIVEDGDRARAGTSSASAGSDSTGGTLAMVPTTPKPNEV